MTIILMRYLTSSKAYLIFFLFLSTRYTMVLIYYTFCLLFMMLLRPLLSYKLADCQGSKAIYSALYFLPILILVHSIFGGIICK